jgi:hypothetical protein
VQSWDTSLVNVQRVKQATFGMALWIPSLTAPFVLPGLLVKRWAKPCESQTRMEFWLLLVATNQL